MTSADIAAEKASPLRKRFGRAGMQLTPGVGGFWRWWSQSLLDWLPPRVREAFGALPERLLLQPSNNGNVRILYEKGANVNEIAYLPWVTAANATDPLEPLLTGHFKDVSRWLLLPSNQGLRHEMQLPVAAAEKLRELMTYEIDRQTPFEAADVYYDTRIVGKHNDQIETELVVVPKTSLNAIEAALGPTAQTIVGADLAGNDGYPLGIDLYAGARVIKTTDRRWLLNTLLVAILVTLLGLGMWQMLKNRRAAVSALEQEIAAMAPKAREASAQQALLQATVSGQTFLANERANRATAVEVLADLTRRLPDSTSLEKISMSGKELMLIGQSNEAAALVGYLQDSKLWKSPALSGATRSDPNSQKDRFTLNANLDINAKEEEPNNGRHGSN